MDPCSHAVEQSKAWVRNTSGFSHETELNLMFVISAVPISQLTSDWGGNKKHHFTNDSRKESRLKY